jgi:Uncharacterized conserved protein
MDFPIARQLFYREINQPDSSIDLAKAALYIALEEYQNFEPEEYLNILDGMADELRDRLPAQNYPLRVIQTINRYLYEDLEFAGNDADYYDPRNSFLNQVIDRRTGIPISLSLVYLEVAKRIDFPMVGIGMPGHFLIKPDFEDAGIFVDAFNGGDILFPEDCQGRLSQNLRSTCGVAAGISRAGKSQEIVGANAGKSQGDLFATGRCCEGFGGGGTAFAAISRCTGGKARSRNSLLSTWPLDGSAQ